MARTKLLAIVALVWAPMTLSAQPFVYDVTINSFNFSSGPEIFPTDPGLRFFLRSPPSLQTIYTGSQPVAIAQVHLDHAVTGTDRQFASVYFGPSWPPGFGAYPDSLSITIRDRSTATPMPVVVITVDGDAIGGLNSNNSGDLTLQFPNGRVSADGSPIPPNISGQYVINRSVNGMNYEIRWDSNMFLGFTPPLSGDPLYSIFVSVPEPSALLLCGVIAPAVSMFRRRRR